MNRAEKRREKRHMKIRLSEIKARLRFLRLKTFWHRRKWIFKVIREKYKKARQRRFKKMGSAARMIAHANKHINLDEPRKSIRIRT